MSHPKHQDAIQLIAGQLPTDRARHLREHAATCIDCRRQLAEDQRLWRLLGRTTVVMPDDGSAFGRRVMHAAGASRTARRSHRLQWLRAAAVVMICVMIGVFAAQWRRAPGWVTAGQVGRQSLKLPAFQNGSPAMFAQSILGFGSEHTRDKTP